jgi:murein DD-endopeptidase MepM/ murein hydrolase activator NlpD
MYCRLLILNFLICCFGVLSVSAAGPHTARMSPLIVAAPQHLVNGSPVLFRIAESERLIHLKGKWLEHEVRFRYANNSKCWYAIAGVPLDTKPGIYLLRLEGMKRSGAEVRFEKELFVGEARYPLTALTVAPNYVEPPKETMVRIAQEQTVKKETFAQTAPEPLWEGRFVPPAPARITGVFGSARVFNGVKRNQHTGLDFGVASGSPIHAANAGRVILARNLFFEGNCVAIDHGEGLITLYLHLSKFKVQEGTVVKKGQVLGLSGATGRATAPHLHFAVRWQGMYLDPAALLKLSPPVD